MDRLHMVWRVLEVSDCIVPASLSWPIAELKKEVGSDWQAQELLVFVVSRELPVWSVGRLVRYG